MLYLSGKVTSIMNPQVCVNCFNEKAVNSTTNRLVTESCGHVKCIDCLINEKSGCIACLKEKTVQEHERIPVEDSSLPLHDDTEVVSTNTKELIEPQAPELDLDLESGDDIEEVKRFKPDTSHIKIEIEDGRKHYFCTCCKKKFQARTHVSYHAYCNGQEKPYRCNECAEPKSFATLTHFKYHIRVHRKEKSYSCEVCGAMFVEASKLQRHKLKHTKVKNFPCPSCSKAFNNGSALRKHLLTHSEEKPYVCVPCARRFRDGSNYRKHMRNQHDEHGASERCVSPGRREFQCPRCPQAFRSKKDMRRHSAVHTDSKPFRCKVCNRRFRRKDNLERHIRNTHPDYDTTSAIEYDEDALTDQPAPPATTDQPVTADNTNGVAPPKQFETTEKIILEKLNPLPPLSPDVIQRHLQSPDIAKDEDRKKEKSYILEANIARESVIFGPSRAVSSTEMKDPKQEHEYVHKIKKLNWANQKDVYLPPVDARKCMQLAAKPSLTEICDAAPPRNLEVYKKILYLERPEPAKRNGADVQENGGKSNSPEMHWKRKMTFNIN
ncbi:zinc finger protein 558 [Plutella xylostella]|uniref:zinc finger protein 558 n=1 Tax=Plutella xylostella TaxID=51655 RepID=UPI002032B197|nr:zinc finger protein 558 [Plutella xylostella]